MLLQGDSVTSCMSGWLWVLQIRSFALPAFRGMPGGKQELCVCHVEEQTSLVFQGKGLKFLMGSFWVPPQWAGQAL